MASFFDRLNQGRQDAVNKVKSSTEIVRLTEQIKKEKIAQENLFAQLGHLLYSSVKKNTEQQDETIAALCTKIHASELSVKNYQDEINRYKALKVCSHCGHECSEDSVFCSYCGKRLEVVSFPKVKDTPLACPKCGYSVEPNDVFCANCSHKLPE